MIQLTVVLLLLGAYLLGSIPSAVWLGKGLYGVDVREYGSGNAGATNTVRVLGARVGLLVFFLDLLKGFAAVELSQLALWWHPGVQPRTFLMIGAGIFAFLGHVFPVFAGFHGGKGVATLCGVVLAFHYPSALAALGVFALVLIAFRYVSLGSMAAGASYPFFLYFVFGVRNWSLLVFAIMLSLLLLVTHRKNIARLIRGQEPKFRPSRGGMPELKRGADFEE